MPNSMEKEPRRAKSAESVKVVVRCRPLSDSEKRLDPKSIINVESCGCAATITNPRDPFAPPKCFTFDAAYPPSAHTAQIYNEMAYPIVEGVLDGYNGTIFAYGQTGCGKTYTMQGSSLSNSAPSAIKTFETIDDCLSDADQYSEDGSSEQRGIIPRVFDHIFESASVRKGRRYLVVASFLEIYNEEIRDLLAPFVGSLLSSMSSNSPPSSPKAGVLKVGSPSRGLNLRENADKGVYVEGLSRHPVHSPADCNDLLVKGLSFRASGSTLMNSESSRSHSLFTLSLEMISSDALEDDGFCSGGEEHITKGKLNLVDLAGSERQVKTGASGERLREATKINLSLSALGNVISALVDGKSKHVPYRDSKLTRLLQDSLGGNTRTLMIACVSGASSSYTESLSTLRYAHRAKQIENTPQKNEDPKDALLRQFKKELDMLRRALHEKNNSNPNGAGIPDGNGALSNQDLEAETKKLRDSKDRLEADLEELRKLLDQEKNRKRIEGDIDRESLNSGETNSASSKENDLYGDNEKLWSRKDNDPSPVPEAVLHRLVKVQASLVGGERVDDEVLKERRRRRRSQAEKRLMALAAAVEMIQRKEKEEEEESSERRAIGDGSNNSRREGGGKVLMKAFGDVRDELISKTEALKKVRNKVKSLQVEIRDLQSEFESERTDYLETIRRLNQQLKLHQQIIEKITPVLKYECNYSDPDKIKEEAVWVEDSFRWRLPELIAFRTRLPPAEPIKTPPQKFMSETVDSNPQTAVTVEENGDEDGDNLSNALKLKLDRSDAEDFAGNYMRPKRAAELLNRAKEEASKTFGRWKSEKSYSSHGSAAQSEMGYPNPNGMFLRHPLIGNGYIGFNNNSNTWSGSINSAWAAFNPSNAGLTMTPSTFGRKPMRLEALPVLEKKANHKKGKSELNTMELA